MEIMDPIYDEETLTAEKVREGVKVERKDGRTLQIMMCPRGYLVTHKGDVLRFCGWDYGYVAQAVLEV